MDPLTQFVEPGTGVLVQSGEYLGNQALVRIDGVEQRDGNLGVDSPTQVQSATLRPTTDNVEHRIEEGAGESTSRN